MNYQKKSTFNFIKNSIKIVVFPLLSYLLLFEIQIVKVLMKFDLINTFNDQLIQKFKPVQNPKILFDFDTIGLDISEISLLLIAISALAYIFFKKDKFLKFSIFANTTMLLVIFFYGLIITFFYLK